MIAPLALIGLISLPIIVAFYMLRLRRRDLPVGSTFLWQQLVRDVEANAPWQRLRFSWLLLVQLACVLLWDAEWLTRQAALVHWLVVGVLPPAFALWGMEREEE